MVKQIPSSKLFLIFWKKMISLYLNLWLSDLVCLSVYILTIRLWYCNAKHTDGASTMRGWKNGVTARLEKLIPHLITTHCCCHRYDLFTIFWFEPHSHQWYISFRRLALCASGAAKFVKYFSKTFEPLLLSIFLYFHNSYCRKNRYKKVWAAINRFLFLLLKIAQLFMIPNTLLSPFLCAQCPHGFDSWGKDWRVFASSWNGQGHSSSLAQSLRCHCCNYQVWERVAYLFYGRREVAWSESLWYRCSNVPLFFHGVIILVCWCFAVFDPVNLLFIWCILFLFIMVLHFNNWYYYVFPYL